VALSLGKALDWLYPSRCCLCATLGDAPICDLCRASFAEIEGGPTYFGSGEALDYHVSIYQYEGRARQAILRYKMDRVTALEAPLAALIQDHVGQYALMDGVTHIMPVPIHWRRRVWRGFNQAEGLLHGFPSEWVFFDTLIRTKSTRPQAGLTMEERRENLVGAFQCQVPLPGAHVLLVDDIYTSGATARGCAQVLRAKGAQRVGVLTFASGA